MLNYICSIHMFQNQNNCKIYSVNLILNVHECFMTFKIKLLSYLMLSCKAKLASERLLRAKSKI